MKRMKRIGLVLAALLAVGTLRADNFNNLFRVMIPRGDCQIRRAGQDQFEPVIKGKAYPYGSTLRTGKDSDMVVAISSEDAVRLMSDTQVDARIDHATNDCRIISLRQGELLVRLNVINTNETLAIETPACRCVSMVGNAKIRVAPGVGESTTEVRAESSCRVKVIGPQFVIPGLQSGNGIEITSLIDNSMTRIRDLVGDYTVFVNKGLELNPDTTVTEGSHVLLPVAMSTQSAVKIWRERAKVGGSLIVSVLATASDGKGRESYAFVVGKDNFVTQSRVFDLPLPLDDEEEAAGDAAPAADDANLFAAPEETAEEAAPAAAEEAPAQQDNALDEFLF